MGFAIECHRSDTCPDLDDLARLASVEGHQSMHRTRVDWEAGVNRSLTLG